MIRKLLYLYAKTILKVQYPSIRNSKIHKTSKIGYRSNVVNLEMDKHSYTGNNNTIVDTKIGKYCSIASYCSIGGGDHPTNWVSTSPFFYKENEVRNISLSNEAKEFNGNKKVDIGNDVWIGENTFIKAGVSIGNGVIIGAHSVVTKNIPNYAIAVGNPAKVIKYRFDNSVIIQLLEIEWWNMDEEIISKYLEYMDDVQLFIQKIKSIELGVKI